MILNVPLYNKVNFSCHRRSIKLLYELEPSHSYQDRFFTYKMLAFKIQTHIFLMVGVPGSPYMGLVHRSIVMLLFLCMRNIFNHVHPYIFFTY